MKSKRRSFANSPFWTVLMTVVCVIYLYPIFMVFMNSLKVETAITTSGAFTLPTADTFAGLSNYANAIGAKGFLVSFGYTAFITLSSLADKLRLNTPWNICIIYLGFGAGLAVFMFTGFMKTIPVEIEEAAMIDGCNPIQTYFKVVFPILRPTMVSVGILEAMWVWNDYLLPTLVLDIKKYRTISMLIQYFRGSYGRVEMGPMMACIMLTIFPIVVVYLLGQKHIIKGVVAGAVKG